MLFITNKIEDIILYLFSVINIMSTHIIRQQASKLYKTFEKALYMFYQKNIYEKDKQAFVGEKPYKRSNMQEPIEAFNPYKLERSGKLDKYMGFAQGRKDDKY